MNKQREIKFRAWDKKNNAMESPVSWLLIMQTGRVYVSGPMTALQPAPNEQYILMQYTGLKDHKGVEIYEGDIVSGDTDLMFTDFISSFENREVDWKFAGLLNAFATKPQLEVIGNIYENPKLLND